MRMLIPLMVVLMVTLNLHAADPEKAEIEGTYQAKGADISGTKYTADVTIEKVNDTYRVTWTYANNQQFIGAGIRHDDKLSVGWAGAAPEGKVMIGVMVYTIQKSGKLEGKWTILSSGGKTSTETLSPKA